MPTPRFARVLETRRLTPQMIRVVFGGAGSKASPPASSPTTTSSSGSTRRTREPARAPTPSASGTPSAADDRLRRPRRRGVAGPWAAAAQPGDELELRRPRRRLHARPGRRLAPDDRRRGVIPAIAASLAAHPGGMPVHVLIAVDGPEEEQPLDTPGDLHLPALRRARPGCSSTRSPSSTFPPAASTRSCTARRARPQLRRHLLVDRGLTPRGAVDLRLLEAHAHRGRLARGQGGVGPPRRGGRGGRRPLRISGFRPPGEHPQASCEPGPLGRAFPDRQREREVDAAGGRLGVAPAEPAMRLMR